jgi:hypothetical protein
VWLNMHRTPLASLSLYASALGLSLLVLALAACGGTAGSGAQTSSPQASTSQSPASQPAAASQATSVAAPSSASLAPDPNGPVARCLLGGRPVNIEFYGIDANNMCTKYVAVLAALGLGNLPVHLSTQGGDIPSGATVGCDLSYPLSFGNLYAGVNGYTNGDLTGDPGPLAKKVCKRLLQLKWHP